MILEINISLLIIIIAVFLGIFTYIVLFGVIRRRKIEEIKNKIIDKKTPLSFNEAKIYERVMEQNRDDDYICAWGCYMLFKYYKENLAKSNTILPRVLNYGKRIRDELTMYHFYEDAMFMLGNLYFFETFEFEKAEQIYSELLRNKKHTKWGDICKSRIDIIKSDAEENALKTYVTAEKKFEDSNFEDAKFYLKKILDEYPGTDLTVSALFFLGDINYYKLDNLGKALENYRNAYENFPENAHAPHALYKVGEILRVKESWGEAAEVYKEYVSKYKGSSYMDDAHYYLGECYLKQGELRAAKNAFSLVLGDYPESKWTEVIYLKVQNINKALKEM